MLDFLSAIGLIFILEGLLLFASPKRLKKILQIITIYPENKIRMIGGVSVLIGIVLLWIIRKWIINESKSYGKML